ncbi:MAG: cation:proton antiporter [Pseudolabrys sp.]
MEHAPNPQGIVLFLVVAGILVPLFHRARIGTVLGFLIAGVALGPGGLGRFAADYDWIRYVTFNDPRNAELLSEAGIVIMLFLLGLEVSVQRLWQLRRYVLGVGLAQVAISAVVIGAAVRVAVAPPPAGLILGLCLALSSTAIVMQILEAQHRVAQPVGRIALSVLLFQDLMVVPILFVVGIFANSEQGRGLVDVILPFAVGFVAVAAIMATGRFVVAPLLRSAMRTGSRDLMIAIALLILVAFSFGTGAIGLSIALGAFLAGMLLSDSEVRHQIETDLDPFKGLLLGVFFITVGAKVDVVNVVTDLVWIVLAVAALMAGKAAVMYGVSRAFGVARPLAAELALLLSQAGEFAFVVIGVATAGGLLSARVSAGTVAVVGLSMMLTPLLAGYARKLSIRLERADSARVASTPEAMDLENHVVIGGYGRVGQMIARALTEERVPFVALDTNGDRVAELRLAGHPVFYGDASRPELMEKLGAGQARAFVVTVSDRAAAERMVGAARRINRSALIFARAADAQHAARLVRRGAYGVIPEMVEASLQLTGRLLESLDMPDEAAQRRIDLMRAEEIERLDRAEAELAEQQQPAPGRH